MIEACDFFTKEEQQRIEATVKAAELKTSGEIVPMVVTSSSDYPRSEWFASGAVALGLGLCVSWMLGDRSILWFLPVYLLSFLVCFLIIHNYAPLKRWLIHPDELTAQVRNKALVSFLEQGLHETRDKTGILILVSLFEHRVQVLADSGINERVPEHSWDEIVAIVTNGLKQNQACDAICRAVERCAELLLTHFPRKDDDTNELPDLILENKKK